MSPKRSSHSLLILRASVSFSGMSGQVAQMVRSLREAPTLTSTALVTLWAQHVMMPAGSRALARHP